MLLMFELPTAAAEPVRTQPGILTRRLARHERLFAVGEPCQSLYSIRSGFFKTRMADAAGREQVLSFFMQADLLGLDGLASELHTVDAIALEDSEVAVMPVAGRLAQANLAAELAKEVARQYDVIMVLGSLNAPERLVSFLIDLSQRLSRLGYSSTEFHLRMTRADIASYLGLKLETVSRMFSELQRGSLIAVEGKHVRITDRGALEAVLRAGY